MKLARRRAGNAVPYGRLTIALQIVLAIVVSGYLVTRFHVGLPVINPQYDVRVVLSDAAGLDTSHRPRVLIAGVPSGSVTKVRYSPSLGKSIATLSLDEGTKGKVHTDATVRIYPQSALQDLVLDIAPGTRDAPVLRPGALVEQPSAVVPVGYDKVTGVLDADTRAYAQILIGTLGRGLANRSGPLRAAIGRLPSLTASTTTLARELATRRHLLAEFVAQFDRITNVTGRRGSQLAGAIRAAQVTLRTTAGRTAQIEQAMQLLPTTLGQATNTFGEVEQLATRLIPALDALLPAAHSLPAALRSTRSLIPPASGLVADLRPLVTNGLAPVQSLRTVAGRLTQVSPQLQPAISTLRKYVDAIDANKQYVAGLVNNWPGAVSENGTLGAETRALFLGMDGPYPQLFGLPGSTARNTGANTRFLDSLEQLLSATCLTKTRTACYALPAVVAKLAKGTR
jgi:phospholipid/cholesterol/gamma-HCH transport system substrate-binding protein